MRGRRKALIVAAVLACSMPLAVSAAVSPTVLLGSILGAGRSARSVHYVSTASRGAVRVGQVGDAGVTEGVQRITYREGGKTGSVTVIVSADTAYVRGDTFGLVHVFGIQADRGCQVRRGVGSYPTFRPRLLDRGRGSQVTVDDR